MDAFDLTLTVVGNSKGLDSVRLWLDGFSCRELTEDLAFLLIPTVATALVNDDGREIRVHIAAANMESGARIRQWFADQLQDLAGSGRGRTIDAVWQRAWLVAA